jgi:phosphate-selective porin OprO and OprP
MTKFLYTASALGMALVSQAALAAGSAADTVANLVGQVEVLKEQLHSIQQQLEALKAESAADREALAQETEIREAAVKAARDANLAVGGQNVFENGTVKMMPPANPKAAESATHRFSMTSADGTWSIAPTGRIHLDVGGFLNQKAESSTGPGTAASGKLSSGVNARRARIGITGKAMGDFTYTLILDAGGGSGDATAAINEARFGYTGIRNTIIEFGYGSQYFTLEDATSSNDIMFMERSTPTTLATNFNSGDPRGTAGFRAWENNWWFGAYLTSSTPNITHSLTNRGFGAYERFTYQPYQAELASLHVGVGSAQVFEIPNSGPGTAASFTMSDRPENRIDGTSLLSTGSLGTVTNPVTSVGVYDFETAATYGSLFYQGEYFHYVVERRGKPKAQFDGAYAQVSYTIGGRRVYMPATGAYSGVNPITPFSPTTGGMGAFEFAARISYVDLVDRYNSSVLATAQPFMVNGGRQVNYTAALNWFLNSNMLVKLDFIHTNIDKDNAITATSPVPTGAGIKLDAVIARFQAMF